MKADIFVGLSDQGVAIRRAHHKEQTLSEIEQKNIDVVRLDLMIAGTYGIELLRDIKAMDALVKVILWSTKPIRRGVRLGAFDFLFKSTDIADLYDKLQDAYRKRSYKKKKSIRLDISWIKINKHG